MAAFLLKRNLHGDSKLCVLVKLFPSRFAWLCHYCNSFPLFCMKIKLKSLFTSFYRALSHISHALLANGVCSVVMVMIQLLSHNCVELNNSGHELIVVIYGGGLWLDVTNEHWVNAGYFVTHTQGDKRTSMFKYYMYLCYGASLPTTYHVHLFSLPNITSGQSNTYPNKWFS